MAKKKTVTRKKKAVRSSKKTPSVSSLKDEKSLKKIMESMLKQIEIMKKKSAESAKKIALAKQKAAASPSGTQKKLKSLFELEGLKINSFHVLEPHVKTMVPLMNKAYTLATKIGGKIKNDYLDICQDLTKGFNLVTLEKDLKRLKKDLSAS